LYFEIANKMRVKNPDNYVIVVELWVVAQVYLWKSSTTDAAAKYAFDVLAALEWSGSVSGEGGDDYATAVKWCFTGLTGEEKSWRGEMNRNVVQPFERCMEHFQTAAISR
jgi:hypothetical protein